VGVPDSGRTTVWMQILPNRWIQVLRFHDLLVEPPASVRSA